MREGKSQSILVSQVTKTQAQRERDRGSTKKEKKTAPPLTICKSMVNLHPTHLLEDARSGFFVPPPPPLVESAEFATWTASSRERWEEEEEEDGEEMTTRQLFCLRRRGSFPPPIPQHQQHLEKGAIQMGERGEEGTQYAHEERERGASFGAQPSKSFPLEGGRAGNQYFAE